MRKFVADLSDTIRIALSLPPSTSIGFYEEHQYGPEETWTEDASQALQTCEAMVCLLSPAYFHSELAGKEWQLFEQRRQKYGQRPAPVILPVSWIPSSGSVPLVVSDMLSRPDSIYQSQPITTILKSASLREYAEFAKTLAYKIIDAAAQVDPLPLEPFPSMPDVPNAFYLWDGPPIAPSESKESSSNRQRQPPTPPQTQNPQNKYSTFAISKSSDFLDMIEDSCEDSFAVTRHPDPDHAMRRVKRLISQDREREVPELFVIDLDGGKDEFNTVKELSEELDVPSGILAVSSKFDRSIWDQLKGATPLFGNFDKQELIDQMKVCATIGRDIRSYRDDQRQGLDPTRNREVFLSYRSLDKGLATVLRRSLEARKIGVSYMDDDDATRWKHKIETWISEARIFLALVTENYLTSKFCEDELSRFTHILEHPQSYAGKRKLNLILNLYNKPDTHKHDLIEKCREEYDVFPMSDADFPVRLSRLVTRIQNLLTKPAA